MTREDGWKLVQEKVKSKNIQKHMLATEAIMRALARRFRESEDRWGLAGLLHDLDYDHTLNDPERHSLLTVEWLKAQGVEEGILQTILAHAGKVERQSLMEKGIYAADPLTGLIIAAALIRQEKKLEAIDKDFVMNRFKEKGFARGARREDILTCEQMGLPLEEFIGLGLMAMQGIAQELGL